MERFDIKFKRDFIEHMLCNTKRTPTEQINSKQTKKTIQEKKITISSHQAIKFPTDRPMSTGYWPTALMTLN